MLFSKFNFKISELPDDPVRGKCARPGQVVRVSEEPDVQVVPVRSPPLQPPDPPLDFRAQHSVQRCSAHSTQPNSGLYFGETRSRMSSSAGKTGFRRQGLSRFRVRAESEAFHAD